MAKPETNPHQSAESSNYHGFKQANRSMTDSSDSENSARSPSSASFPTTQEWFKRLTLSSSVATSTGSNSNNIEMMNDLTELIARCLYKCGEEKGYLPLFKLIFTALNEVEENRYTRLLDGRARDILLTGVITRMIVHVSRSIGLVFICDDIQCM